MKKLIYIGLVLILGTGCDRFLEFGGEEVLDEFDNRKVQEQLVVEGLITDMDTIQTIRVSKTNKLNSDLVGNTVSEATVQVLAQGETIPFDFVDSLQAYVARFKGIQGVTYRLEVEWQDKQFHATSEMADLQEFSVDSIEVRKAIFDFNHFRWFDLDAPFRQRFNNVADPALKQILITQDDDYEFTDTLPGGRLIKHSTIYVDPADGSFLEGYKYGDLAEFWFGPNPYVINAAEPDKVMNVYKIYLYSQESQIETNYYRFDVKRNGRSWLQPGQIIVADDFAIGENIAGIEFPGYFVEGDQVEFFMYGISREAYNFYTSLLNTMQNDGGGFSPPPGNPVTNIYDEAGNPGLGFFEVARVAYQQRIISGQ